MNMLQDYPAQVQPKSSSTRQPPIVVDTEEASNILMTLANQQTSDTATGLSQQKQQDGDSDILSGHLIGTKKTQGQQQHQNNHTNHSSIAAPFKDRGRSDPIMLLAAAAAAIDSSNIHERPKKYYGRSYKRREIVIQRRSTDESVRRHVSHDIDDDEDSTQQDHFTLNGNGTHDNHITNENGSGTLDQQRHDPSYALQYLSMKQNPKIKRNAMHAYITYMIYTDLANDTTGVYKKTATPFTNQTLSSSSMEDKKQHTNKRSSEEIDSTPLLPRQASSASSPSPSTSLTDYLPNKKMQHSHLSTIDTTSSSYGLPPSPPPTSTPLHHQHNPHQQHHHHQQYQPPHQHQYHQKQQKPLLLPPTSSSSSLHHRPLTAFLWDSNSTSSAPNNNSNGTNILPSLSSRSNMILPPLAPPPSSRQPLL
ncbi:unnamed protein product [Absidia cylindrospora]